MRFAAGFRFVTVLCFAAGFRFVTVLRFADGFRYGFGAEIAAQIADIGFKYLDAPLKRVASKDVPIAYAPVLEDSILVQTSWIENAIQEVIEF